VAGVRQVLKEAKRRRLIDHNALDDRECYLRSGAPNRSFLENPQILAVLEAARRLDQEQRPLDGRDVRAIRGSDEPATRVAARYGVSDTLIRRIRRAEIWTEDRPRESGRLPVVATLLLAGPRILELSKLDRPDLDLAAREIRMPQVKTAASERSVPMLPALHEILLTQSAERRSRKGPAFLTRNGTRQHPDNIR
jgi:integrase